MKIAGVLYYDFHKFDFTVHINENTFKLIITEHSKFELTDINTYLLSIYSLRR